MLETSWGKTAWQGRERGLPDSRLPDVSDISQELGRHFRENCPILLDGAPPLGSDAGFFVRQARESLIRGRVDPTLLPAAILRETLASIQTRPNPATKAGLTAVGPRRARVWWDANLLDNLDDILAELDRPRPVLRFYDITGLDPKAERWHSMFDIDVELAEEGKSVEFWAADRLYLVDLGYLHADGRFIRLARTNTAELPREVCGDAGCSGTARSNLRWRERVEAIRPDARAREWALSRPDGPERDVDAETVIHMLYRAFLLEGPRALRRSPLLLPRDGDALREEFRQRARLRRQPRASRPAKPVLPSLLIARLDARRPLAAADLRYPPVPAAARFSTLPYLSAGHFALHQALLASARNVEPRKETAAVTPAPNADGEPRRTALVQPLPADSDRSSLSFMATPVFEAAQSLRRQLRGLEPAAPAVDVEDESRRPARIRDFGGSESRRFAKAGVRFTRMALTLEGRMRPGAKLKVAGKLVYADADGNFRLECVLSGRKAAIPMRAGTSIGGEARGMINVEWEKLGAGERKKMAKGNGVSF